MCAYIVTYVCARNAYECIERKPIDPFFISYHSATQSSTLDNSPSKLQSIGHFLSEYECNRSSAYYGCSTGALDVRGQVIYAIDGISGYLLDYSAIHSRYKQKVG